MTVVSASFEILFDVKSRVFASAASVQYDVRARITKSASMEYDIRSRVTKTSSIEYDVRKIISPAKVFSAKYDVRSSLSKSFLVRYGVRVPLSVPKTGSIRYNVRSRVTGASRVIQYDTEITGSGTVSKSFSIRYHTLAASTYDKITTVPVEVDEMPPQVSTTSLSGGW